MPEIVYVFTNPAMPGYVKIGKVTKGDVAKRLKALSNPTGVPAPFVCPYAAVVPDAQKVEKALQVAFADKRPNKRREFFTVSSGKIVALLKAYATADATPATQRILEEVTTPEDRAAQMLVTEIGERRSWLRFGEIGIPLGAELVFTRDSSKKCRVVEDRKVEYEGERLALSALATKLLYGSTTPVRVQGALYFTYEDECHGVELLTDRRDRIESEEEA